MIILPCLSCQLAEERLAARKREKEGDAKYVASTEAFLDSFGKRLT
jgi:hypothetical protein